MPVGWEEDELEAEQGRTGASGGHWATRVTPSRLGERGGSWSDFPALATQQGTGRPWGQQARPAEKPVHLRP